MTLRLVCLIASLALIPVAQAGNRIRSAQTDHVGLRFQSPSAAPAAKNAKLPPSEEGAKAALDRSPRHGEFVDIQVEGLPIRTWVVYPERKDKAAVIMVIHEIFGLSDWIRSVADQLAEEGFIAVAPDLICGKGLNGGCTDSLPSRDDVVKAVRALTPDEVSARLNAVREYSLKIPAGNKRIATVGFCWGGARSFQYATQQPHLNAAVVYYGTSPETAELASVKAPILGLYGEDDARVVATIEPASAEMKRLKKSYEVEIYKGAGHGFLRAQSAREGANLRATEAAWPRTVAFLRKHTR